MPRLSGKTALVTGAARGIGQAIAAAFVAEGAWVCLSDINDAGGRAAAAALGEAARYEQLDVREEADWDRVTAALLADWGGLDVLVNNAGVTGLEGAARPHNPEHASLEDWRAMADDDEHYVYAIAL